jgi:hypothetical protein
VNDAVAMSVGDDLANADERCQQFAQGQWIDIAGLPRAMAFASGLAQGPPADEPHRKERLKPVDSASQVIDRRDPWMLELPGHARFPQEPPGTNLPGAIQ